MRLDEVITTPKLYHGTSLEGLVGIVSRDRISASNVDSAPAGASFTRDYRIAKNKAENAYRHSVKGAVIEFDRDLLVRRYGRKLKPVDVLGIRGAEAFPASEAEERIEGDASGVVAAITAIYLYDLPAYEAFREKALAANPELSGTFTRIQALVT